MVEAEIRCKECNEIIFPEEKDGYNDELCNECYERELKDPSNS